MCYFDQPSDATFYDWSSETTLPAYEAKALFDAEGMKAIESCIDSCNEELRELSLQIHGEQSCQSLELPSFVDLKPPMYCLDHPEIRYEEK